MHSIRQVSMRMLNEFEKTERFLKEKLLGASLAGFQISSMVIVLDVIVSERNLSKALYVSLCGHISLIGERGAVDDRGEVIRSLYALIGEDISDLQIERSGRLSLALKDTWYAVDREEDGFGDITWSVTSDSPSVFYPQEWAVCLDDTNTLVVSVDE